MERKVIQKKSVELHKVTERIGQLLELFVEPTPITIGTLSRVNRTCGNPACYCASKGKGHPGWTLLTKHNGKRRCQLVRKADVDAVAAKVGRYRQLREALREIRNLDVEIYRLVKRLLDVRNETYK
jgi:hypothetical protein